MLSITKGTQVEITITDAKRGDWTFTSVVERLLDKNTVLIQTPTSNGRFIVLPTTEQYTLKFICSDEVEIHRPAVIKRLNEKEIQFTEFVLKGDWRRSHKRDFFRCACRVPASFSQSEFNEAGALVPIGYNDCVITDLSGGGLVLVSQHEVNNGDLVFLSFTLDDHEMTALGEVRRKSKSEYNFNLPFQFGVMFVGLNRNDQDRIVGYAYRQQMEMRRRNR